MPTIEEQADQDLAAFRAAPSRPSIEDQADQDLAAITQRGRLSPEALADQDLARAASTSTGNRSYSAGADGPPTAQRPISAPPLTGSPLPNRGNAYPQQDSRGGAPSSAKLTNPQGLYYDRSPASMPPAPTPPPAPPQKFTPQQVAAKDVLDPTNLAPIGPPGPLESIARTFAPIVPVLGTMMASDRQARQQVRGLQQTGQIPFVQLAPLNTAVRQKQDADLAALRPLVDAYNNQLRDQAADERRNYPSPIFTSPEDTQANEERDAGIVTRTGDKWNWQDFGAFVRAQGKKLTPFQTQALNSIIPAQRVVWGNYPHQAEDIAKDVTANVAGLAAGGALKGALAPILDRGAAAAIPEALRPSGFAATGTVMGGFNAANRAGQPGATPTNVAQAGLQGFSQGLIAHGVAAIPGALRGVGDTAPSTGPTDAGTPDIRPGATVRVKGADAWGDLQVTGMQGDKVQLIKPGSNWKVTARLQALEPVPPPQPATLPPDPTAADPVALNSGPRFTLPQRTDPRTGANLNLDDYLADRSDLTHNLSQLEKADYDTAVSARTAASAEPISRLMYRETVAGIDRVYGQPGAATDFFDALQTSNLMGAADRWRQMAQTATDPAEQAQFTANAATIEQRLQPKLPAFQQFINTPQFGKSLDIYKENLEKPLADFHAANGGTQLQHLGPVDSYFPLTATDANGEVIGPKGGGNRLFPFQTPRNPRAGFRTGLAEGYTVDPAEVQRQLYNAVSANSRAAFLQQMETAGLARELAPGEAPPATFSYQGKDYTPRVVPVDAGRTIINDGKGFAQPPKRMVMPSWVQQETAPILDPERPVQGRVQQLLNAPTMGAVMGPATGAIHAQNVVGTLVGNTPFLGRNLLMNLPFLKRINVLGQLIREDTSTPENLVAQRDLARLGLLPSSTGKSTISPAYAASTGAELKSVGVGPLRIPTSAEPLLKGPSGVDLKARLILYRMAKEIDPRASDADVVNFVGQVGNYVKALQGRTQRNLGHVAPFFEGGKQMGINSARAFIGNTPMPDSNLGAAQRVNLRAQQLFGGGTVGAATAWVLAHRAYTGKWPWNDPRARFGQIPVKDSDRQTALGRAIWGNDIRKTAYLDAFGATSPMVARGARVTGIGPLINTLHAGGTPGQAASDMGRAQLNAVLHPFIGPPAKFGFTAITGQDPYISGFRDRITGRPAISFPQVARTASEGPQQIGENLQAAGYGANPLSEDFFAEPRQQDEGNRLLHAVLGFSGMLGPAIDLNAERAGLARRQQATARAIQKQNQPKR